MSGSRKKTLSPLSHLADREKRIIELAGRSRCKTALSANEIARGAHLCWANAVSLLADVRLLVSNSRYARALSLSVLALEELAKPPLLWSLGPNNDAKDWRTFWNERFSRHPIKQNAIATYGAMTGLDVALYWFKMQPGTVKALDTLKQWGFYVDCVDMSFQSPDLFGSDEKEIVDILFAMAEERADSFGQLHSSPEASQFAYEHRFKGTQPGELWPPPISTVGELRDVLIGLASQYSCPPGPNYAAFLEGCDDLKAAGGDAMFRKALWLAGQVCCARARFRLLPTAGARGLLMFKLCLMAVPENQRGAAWREWDANEGRSPFDSFQEVDG